ncbi:MAG TPA: PIN domain-containing protein [Acidimicrobiales bacterium]|nr:PIN domain-containing protein [Acidimicrobiales bacterium]
MDAFDADVLIFAAAPEHALGRRIRALFPTEPVEPVEPGTPGPERVVTGVGSVLLLPELLTKPYRENATAELAELARLLSHLQLLPTDAATAELAVALGAAYGLRAADSVHLATAVGAGADRFLTNNRSDFPQTISEIDITYPEALPEPGS